MLNAKRKFKDQQILNQMLLLRQAGWTLKNLAVLFKCDFSSIYHHCQKYNIHPITQVTITPNIIGIITQSEIRYVIPIDTTKDKWYVGIDGERVNRGKNYRDYLNESNYKKY